MVNLITTREAASRLGVERREVLRMVDRGEIKIATKIAGHTGAYLFDAGDVAAAAKAAADRAAAIAERASQAALADAAAGAR